MTAQYAMEAALSSYGKCRPTIITYAHAKLTCPVCGASKGGRSEHSGEKGAIEGLQMHLRFSHGFAKKDAAIAAIRALNEGLTNDR